MHNDVRSPNVFLVSLDEKAAVHAKLGDYGLARFAAGKLKMGLQSWQYLAPEVLDPRSAGFDVRADVCWNGAKIRSLVLALCSGKH